MDGKVGNPYPHRYKKKRDNPMTEEEYLRYLENTEKLDMERQSRKENAQHPFDYRIILIKISALLALLYYTGLRVSEIVGDRPHKYFTKDGQERWTEECHGLRKQDIRIISSAIRVDPKEVRKHGHRDEPLWILRDLPGVKYIVQQWESTEEEENKIFPISKWTGWSFISQITGGKLYPHYFRLNRATRFAEQEQTSIIELKQWFGWRRASTADSYIGKAGRVTRKMAERLK